MSTFSPTRPLAGSPLQPFAPGRAVVLPAAPGYLAGFLLFIFLNATLFVRPAEIIPQLLGWEIYLVLILLCLLISFPAVLAQLTSRSLYENPITVCVLGLLPLVVLSHLAHSHVASAALSGFEFAKVVLYYLLLVGVVNSPGRLRFFLFCFTVFCVVLTVLAVLQYHGAIQLPNLEVLEDHPEGGAPIGGQFDLLRLRSTGLFHDPNDLCLILVVGLALSFYWLGEGRFGAFRLLWLPAVVLFFYALYLTHSRGGFLAMLATLFVLVRARIGWARTLLLSLVGLPTLFVLFAGRQTTLSADDSNGQGRIQLWSDALMYIRQYPLFGVGYREFAEYSGLVAHNSYLSCFAELGFLGGMLFLGAVAFGLVMVSRLGSGAVVVRDPQLRRLRPYLLAALAGYAAGMLFLSNSYIAPTYTMLGLTTVFLGMATVHPPLPALGFNLRLLRNFAFGSVGFLAVMYVFVRVFINRI